MSIKNEFSIMFKQNLIKTDQENDEDNLIRLEQNSFNCFKVKWTSETIINVQSLFQITEEGYYFSNCQQIKFSKIEQSTSVKSNGDLGEEYKKRFYKKSYFCKKEWSQENKNSKQFILIH